MSSIPVPGPHSDELTRLNIVNRILATHAGVDADSRIRVAVESMDDAALIEISADDSLIVASDFIRSSGFYLFEMGYLDYFDVGYYLIVANISDIAAMGGKPFGLTTVIRYTKSMTDEHFTQIFLGMKAAADHYGVSIIGGDIGGYSADVFVATALGFIKTNDALLRKNVQANDLLCVTGTVGLPITALTYFKEVKPLGFNFSQDEEEQLLLSWKRPHARVAEGRILSENRIASACQDVSDGLKATIEQISPICGKTFTIYADKLPIANTTRKLASFLGINPVQIAISASVDFELMFTVPPPLIQLCSELFGQNGLNYSVIGEVNSLGRNLLVDYDGNQMDLPGVAWKQQTGDYLKEIIHTAGER